MKQWHCGSQGSGNIGEITVWSLPCAESTQTPTIWNGLCPEDFKIHGLHWVRKCLYDVCLSLSLMSHWGMIFRGRNSQAGGFYHLWLDFHCHAHWEQLAHRKGLQREGKDWQREEREEQRPVQRESESKKRKKQDKVSAHLFLRENVEMV